MKKLLLILVTSASCVGFLGSPVFAIKAFNEAWTEFYVKDSKNEDFKKLSEEAKCNVCHIQGESKKKHNPYGESLESLLKKDDYKADRLKAEPEKVKEELEAAYKKVESEKAKDGKTFKERIDAGMLPGGDKDGK